MHTHRSQQSWGAVVLQILRRYGIGALCVVAIIIIGLAHYTTTLRNLAGPATDGLPLAEYLAKKAA
jgi:hypothetical protein